MNQQCRWWVGPIWKLDGETCVCVLPSDHPMPHVCTCGAWFEDCGYPPEETAHRGLNVV